MVLAQLGVELVEAFGEPATLRILRGANVLGLAALTWCGLAPLGLRPWRRALLAATLAIALPGARQGMYWGNLSLAASGMIVAALTLWPRHSAVAGALLGGSVALKPLAPLAGLALLVHRPRTADRRAALVTCAAAAALGAALLLVPGGLGDYLTHGPPSLSERSASWHRLAYLAGFPLQPLLGLALVALVTARLVRRVPLARDELTAAACAAALAATPLVWNHTLLLAFPAGVLAVAVLLRRRSAGLTGRYEAWVVALGCAAIAFGEGATGIDNYPTWLQVMGVLPPACAPTGLTVYGIVAARRQPAGTVRVAIPGR